MYDVDKNVTKYFITGFLSSSDACENPDVMTIYLGRNFIFELLWIFDR